MTKTLYIDPELQAWLDPLSPTELAGLEASLLEEGCRDPLVVWDDGCLLDGHNRYALCTKHGIAFETVEKTGLVTKEDAKLWMIENQRSKRNMTDFARVALALKRKPLLEARAMARMVAGKADPRLNSDEGPVRTDELVAKAAGVGRDTVRKVEMIIEKADADVIAKVRTGELSINAAAKTVTQPKLSKTTVETEDIEPEPKVAPRLSSEQGEVTVTNVDEMVAEIAALREENADLKIALAETLAENEQMGRVFDADDPVKASMAEVARFAALAENAERTLAARTNEFNERARNVAYWKNRAEKAEKQLAKTEAAGEASVLRAKLHERDVQLNVMATETNVLIEQLEGLTEMFREAMTCHDEMRAILEANVPSLEMPHELRQVLELTRTLESRVANAAARRYAEARYEEDDFTQSTEDNVSVHGEDFGEPIETESFEYMPSDDGDMAMC